MDEPDPYSVRCENCETTFAPGTRNCVHCGAPIGQGLMAALRSAAGDADPGEAEEPRGRGWGVTVFVILAVAFQLLRQCA